MSKHTEGPWRLSSYHYPHREIVADRGTSGNDSRPEARLICRIADNGKPSNEWMANARLIAAAPETKKQRDALLTACTKAHDALLALHVCNQDKSFADEIRTLLKAAIGKATE